MVKMENGEAQRQTEKVLSGLPKREEQKKMPLDTGKQKTVHQGEMLNNSKAAERNMSRRKRKKPKNELSECNM